MLKDEENKNDNSDVDFQINLAQMRASASRFKEYVEVVTEKFTFHAETIKKLYDAFIAQGFTKEEALDLVKDFYKPFFI